MILGRVLGSVVATRKHPNYQGKALLLIQPLDLDGDDEGKPVLAVDSVGAGAGEKVLIVIEGRSASHAMRRRLSPANAAIVGIVDHVEREA